MKEFFSLAMVAMEIGQRQFLSYHSNGCYEEKRLYQKLESYYHWKYCVHWISVSWDKISQPQKCKLLEKGHKS